MNSSKKKKNVSAFDENDFVPINLVYNSEQKIIKYVYTKKYHTFGNYVCVQNVYSVHFYVNYKGFRQSKEFTLTHYVFGQNVNRIELNVII